MQDINDTIAENTGLIYKQLLKFGLADNQDAESIAYEALYNAILSYNETKNTKFSTYATVCIYNALGTFMRSLNKKRQLDVTSYNRVAYIDNETEHEFVDFISTYISVETEYINNETLLRIRYVFNSYVDMLKNEKHRRILMCWDASNFKATATDIAKEVGVSQSYVSQVLATTKSKLRQLLKEEQK